MLNYRNSGTADPSYSCAAHWDFSAKVFRNWVSNGDVAKGGNCKHAHQGVKIALVQEGKGQEFSELVEDLLAKWLMARR